MPNDPLQEPAFAAALRAAMESPDRELEITGPDGGRMRVIKAPEPGVKARIELAAGGSGSQVTVLWEATEARPAGYPNELPFIPNAGARILTIVRDGLPRTQVQWFGVADLESVVQRLVADSLSEGWQHTGGQLRSPEPARVITLERGTEERTITVRAVPGLGMISLVDAG